jgi:hypothetical protein
VKKRVESPRGCPKKRVSLSVSGRGGAAVAAKMDLVRKAVKSEE